MPLDKEVMNNDNNFLARITIHNVGDGVQVLLVYRTGQAKTLLWLSGAQIPRAVSSALYIRPGGRVAEIKS
jgi:hypothetical protein